MRSSRTCKKVLWTGAIASALAITIAGIYLYKESDKREKQLQEKLLLNTAEELQLVEDIEGCLHIVNDILENYNPQSFEAQRLKALCMAQEDAIADEAQKALQLAGNNIKDITRVEIILELFYLQQQQQQASPSSSSSSSASSSSNSSLLTAFTFETAPQRTREFLQRLDTIISQHYPYDDDLLVERAAFHATLLNVQQVREDCELVMGLSGTTATPSSTAAATAQQHQTTPHSSSNNNTTPSSNNNTINVKTYNFAKAAYLYSFTFQNNVDEQLRYLNMALEQEPNFFSALYERANIFTRILRQPDKALIDINAILSLNARHCNALNLFATCMIQKGNFYEAEETLKKIIALNPQQLTAYVTLAQIYAIIGNNNNVTTSSGSSSTTQASSSSSSSVGKEVMMDKCLRTLDKVIAMVRSMIQQTREVYSFFKLEKDLYYLLLLKAEYYLAFAEFAKSIAICEEMVQVIQESEQKQKPYLNREQFQMLQAANAKSMDDFVQLKQFTNSIYSNLIPNSKWKPLYEVVQNHARPYFIDEQVWKGMQIECMWQSDQQQQVDDNYMVSPVSTTNNVTRLMINAEEFNSLLNLTVWFQCACSPFQDLMWQKADTFKMLLMQQGKELMQFAACNALVLHLLFADFVHNGANACILSDKFVQDLEQLNQSSNSNAEAFVSAVVHYLKN